MERSGGPGAGAVGAVHGWWVVPHGPWGPPGCTARPSRSRRGREVPLGPEESDLLTFLLHHPSREFTPAQLTSAQIGPVATAPASPSIVDEPRRHTPRLDADGTSVAQADRNRLSGRYTLQGSSLTLVPGRRPGQAPGRALRLGDPAPRLGLGQVLGPGPPPSVADGV
jgi:hypothetical protein